MEYMFLDSKAISPFLLVVAAVLIPTVAQADEPSLRVIRDISGDRQELRKFALSELSGLKQVTSREREVGGSDPVAFRGPLLSVVVDEAMKALTVEQRAAVDLILLKGESGAQAIVPRSFIVKYPMLLATALAGKGLGERGPILSVPPWTSREAKVKLEQLPVETYFVPRLQEVVLTNFQSRFGTYYLKRKTDPVAMRGQKYFVNSCVSCHAAGHGPSLQVVAGPGFIERTRSLASGSHPQTPGFLQPGKRDGKALNRYLDAHRSENGKGEALASDR